MPGKDRKKGIRDFRLIQAGSAVLFAGLAAWLLVRPSANAWTVGFGILFGLIAVAAIVDVVNGPYGRSQ